jgi:hypothetical protein
MRKITGIAQSSMHAFREIRLMGRKMEEAFGAIAQFSFCIFNSHRFLRLRTEDVDSRGAIGQGSPRDRHSNYHSAVDVLRVETHYRF